MILLYKHKETLHCLMSNTNLINLKKDPNSAKDFGSFCYI